MKSICNIPSVFFQGEILHAKLTLLLMHVCQLVLFVQQSTTFSTRTVRFLRILEMTRQNFVSPFTNYVSQKLKNSGLQISDMWMRLGGRFCAPRLDDQFSITVVVSIESIPEQTFRKFEAQVVKNSKFLLEIVKIKFGAILDKILIVFLFHSLLKAVFLH